MICYTHSAAVSKFGNQVPLTDTPIYLQLEQTHLDDSDLTLVHEVVWHCQTNANSHQIAGAA